MHGESIHRLGVRQAKKTGFSGWTDLLGGTARDSLAFPDERVSLNAKPTPGILSEGLPHLELGEAALVCLGTSSSRRWAYVGGTSLRGA